MSLKDLIFQKGGIGVSMSRQETIERLNPLIEQHMALNHGYNFAIAHLSERPIADDLAALQKVARVDVGKLMETVFSCGGVAYNGVDLEPDDFHLGADDDAILFALLDEEQALLKALIEAMTLPHQIRTRAILNVVQTNSQQRVNYLKNQTMRRRRKPARDFDSED